MLHHLRGKLTLREPSLAVIETGGVGLALKIPLSTFEQLPPLGETCHLFTHLHLTEGDMSLFGFASPPERALFRALLTVSGIGPALALTILSGAAVPALVTALHQGDENYLRKIKGIGPKTASRLIVELKDVVVPLLPETVVASPLALLSEKQHDATKAVMALMQVPFDRAAKAVQEATQTLPETVSLQELIRAALGKAR